MLGLGRPADKLQSTVTSVPASPAALNLKMKNLKSRVVDLQLAI